MQEWPDRAIILRYGHFREADLWLRVLLESHGLLTLFAFGGAKSRRRFCGCLDRFNTISCRVRPSRGGEYLCLEEAGLLSAPLDLRKDWKSAGIAANCMRFAEACGIGPETSREAYGLAQDLLEGLDKQAMPAQTPLFFRLRLATALGFGPDFSTCLQCGSKIEPWGYFLVEEARTLCPVCSLAGRNAHGKRGIKLAGPALDLLQKVKQNLPRSWPASASGADMRQAAQAIDGFVQFHLGLEWQNGTFRRI